MKVLVWLLGSVFSAGVHAQTLSDAALYKRCYTTLTGLPVPRNSSVMKEVRAGRVKALDACTKLIEIADLTDAGPLFHRDDPEARAVLNNFHSFHRSWFKAQVVEDIQGFSTEMSIGTPDIIDTTEGALALTRTLFLQSAKYRDVLTAPHGFAAQRIQNANATSLTGYVYPLAGRRYWGNNAGLAQNLFHFASFIGFDGNSDTATSTFMNVPGIEVGELIGVRPRAESFQIPNVELHPLGTQTGGHTVPGLNFSFDLYKTLGGGVLGMPSYLLANYGQNMGSRANGTNILARRWSENSLNTFMCLEVPTLRESDIKNLVVGNSSAAFRNSASCVMCHATLDPMAYTVRNAIPVNSDYAMFGLGGRTHSKTSMLLTTFRADFPSVSGWPSEPVADFHRQAPTGRLFYRSLSGELIDRQVANVSALGQAMTETEDYYACAAKRYFQFMTGIDIPLYDRANPAHAETNRKLSESSIKARNFVEELGRELRKTQSVRLLIKSILSSSYFRDLNFEPEGAP